MCDVSNGWSGVRAGVSISLSVLAIAMHGSAQSAPQLVLTDIAEQVGLNWVQHDNLTMMGSGGAFLDFDGDGWQDILLSGGCSTPTLFRNVQGTSFEVVPNAVFPAGIGYEYMCVTVADIDDDGDPDVFFGRWGPNLLYRNDGGGVFTDVTTPMVAGGVRDFTTSAAFADFDGDGRLDLYIGNYVALPFSFPRHTPTPNVLLRGNGDCTFADWTHPTVAGAGTTLATTWTDYDGDGDVDMFVGNDFGAFVQPNQLCRNDGPPLVQIPGSPRWRFTETSTPSGCDLAIYCMGIAIGDIDRDGDFDYYFTNLGRNVLLRNDGAAGFVDITTATGTEVAHDPATSPLLLATSWGTGFHDLDCDGWLDLYVSNGHIPAAPFIANGTNTANVLMRHDGQALTFSQTGGELDDGIGRGCAFADFDRDGDIDILQCGINAPAQLLRNDSPRRGRWLATRLTGRASARDALGARIDVDVGSFVACREISRNYSFESSSQAAAHFGLGAVTRARSIAVRWPSGRRQQIFDVALDRELALTEPHVTAVGGLRRYPGTGGDWLLAWCRVRNEADHAIEVTVEPQVRAGDASLPPVVAGSVLLRGEARVARLRARASQSIELAMFVPSGGVLPAGLDFVWSTEEVGVPAARTEVEFALPTR